nr:DUF4386 domain-containing protein [candidate division Zixibacteria bacterium]
MTDYLNDISPRMAAKIAGAGYLVIILCGVFAEFFVRSRLIVPGDAAATASNIMASEFLFRIGIAGDLIMLVFDVVVALALYVLLRPVNKSLALLAAFFRLTHTAINGINLLNSVFALLLVNGPGYLTSFRPDQLYSQMLLFLNAHSYGYLIALVFFGFHCLILGYLIIKSDYIPGVLGILMIAASFGYLIDSFANILLSGYADYKTIFLIIVAVPAIVAELSLCLWLLFKGGEIRI